VYEGVKGWTIREGVRKGRGGGADDRFMMVSSVLEIQESSQPRRPF